MGGLAVPAVPPSPPKQSSPPTKKKTTPSREAVNSIDFDFTDDEQESEETRQPIYEGLLQTTDCKGLQRRIRRFLDEKTMTESEFRSKLGGTEAQFHAFMDRFGVFREIETNPTFKNALFFFRKLDKKREKIMAQLAPPRVEKNPVTQALFEKIRAVELQEPVYIYDDCDTLRRKINELIKSKRVSQAALLRELDVSSNSLRRFLATWGPREGCTNCTYYAAYCFFEKMRIAENQPKSEKRLENEAERPTGFKRTNALTYADYQRFIVRRRPTGDDNSETESEDLSLMICPSPEEQVQLIINHSSCLSFLVVSVIRNSEAGALHNSNHAHRVHGEHKSALLFFHKFEKKRDKLKYQRAGAPRVEKNAETQALFEKVRAVTLQDPVYIYDDCDALRTKINDVVQSKRVTQAALLRELNVNSNSLRRFMAASGPRDGCTNCAYVSITHVNVAKCNI
ncbi:hypothetical protein Poli38472_001069 [Pythium oligandrum]|uniref:DUF7726 domain-containing protein n=1 Tax=Pythium oligandrum TaxID=41045 RepID=A0A8K1CTZ5_PYTOL|nr:hypothetical protein Poli38472_001069 [Pythium oligandrum]|eukprot:TMW68913.1 hypothetical protein Poli38472_001069 [Pythium oligandrum]